MTVYLDASVLVALFVRDAFNSRAEALVASADTLVVSDFGASELSSAVSRRVRDRMLTEPEARTAFANFDIWRGVVASERVQSEDVAQADALVRRLELGLRAPDAIHIAIARRLGAQLATFDQRMAAAAASLGVSVLA